MLYSVGVAVLLLAGSVEFVYVETVGVKCAKTPFCLTAIVLISYMFAKNTLALETPPVEDASSVAD